MKKYLLIGVSAFVLGAGSMAYVSQHAMAAATPRAQTYRMLGLFGDVLDTVERQYVTPVDDTKLIHAALDGMLTSLDPHSGYLDPEGFDDMRDQTRGEYGGLGLEVTSEDGVVKVISPMDDTPAAKAGVKPGDFITAVHGRPLGTTPTSEQRFSEGYKGAVQDFGIGLDIAQGGTGQLPLKVLRPGQGEVSLNLTLPVIGATGVAFPEAGDFKQLLFERSCADIHSSISASGADLQNIGYNVGWYGLVMLAHPNWNVTTGDKPYGLSVQKMRDYAA